MFGKITELLANPLLLFFCLKFFFIFEQTLGKIVHYKKSVQFCRTTVVGLSLSTDRVVLLLVVAQLVALAAAASAGGPLKCRSARGSPGYSGGGETRGFPA